VKPDPLQLQEMLKVALDDAVLVGRGETATSSAEARAALLLLISLSNVSTRIFEAPRSSVVEDRWLSTEDVARILNASRPYVVKLADAGRLGDVQRTEGGQRRILATAVEIYRNERKTQSRKALEELSAISQEVSSPGSRRNESNLPDSSND
jgi:excisionase family DNA binding protein